MSEVVTIPCGKEGLPSHYKMHPLQATDWQIYVEHLRQLKHYLPKSWHMAACNPDTSACTCQAPLMQSAFKCQRGCAGLPYLWRLALEGPTGAAPHVPGARSISALARCLLVALHEQLNEQLAQRRADVHVAFIR